MVEKGLEIKSCHIKYKFTVEEKKDIALEMAKKISEKEDLELKKKEVTSKITSEISAANAAAANRAKELNQGYTYKNTDCYEIFDYDTKTVFTHRADTDDQVEVRTMSSSEFQRELFDPREEIKEDELIPKDGELIASSEKPKKEKVYFNDKQVE